MMIYFSIEDYVNMGLKNGEKDKRSKAGNSSKEADVPPPDNDLAAEMSERPAIPKLIVKTTSGPDDRMDSIVGALKEQGETMKVLVGTLTSFMEASQVAAAAPAPCRKRRAPATAETPVEEGPQEDDLFGDEDDEEAEDAFEEENEEQPSLLETFGSSQNHYAPTEFQLSFWGKVCCLFNALVWLLTL